MSKIDWLKKLNWNEDHLDELRNAGYAYVRQGKYDTALVFFEALVILNPKSGSHYSYDIYTLGSLYMQINKLDKAIKCFNRVLQLEGTHAPALLNLAKIFFAAGKIEDGLKLAQILQNDANRTIANTAAALLLAYQPQERGGDKVNVNRT
jgi:tetratricopeptide (TPR) repeat protein